MVDILLGAGQFYVSIPEHHHQRTSDTCELLAVLLELEDDTVDDNSFLSFRAPRRCIGR